MDRSRWSVAWASLLCPFLIAASPVREPPPIAPGDPEARLIPYLNFRWPEQHGIVTGSCLVKSIDKNTPVAWVYVLLPRSSQAGALLEILPDASGPAFATGGDLHLAKNKPTVELVQGGLGMEATMEGAAEWIMRHRLTLVSTYDEALASRPTLRCPDDMTMMQWRFGHRPNAKPAQKAR